jgi:hypothetical protein
MSKYAEVDTSRFPLVYVTFTGEKANDTNFQAYLDAVRACYDRQEPLAIIFDGTNANLPGFTYQKMQADWLRKNESLMTNFCKGTAYIIPSPFVKAILKAIFALQRQPVPYEVFGTVEEGEQWVKGQLG